MHIQIDDPQDDRICGYRDIRERDLVGRDGKFVAEGRIVLAVLAASASYSIESVLVLESRLSANERLLDSLPDQTPVFIASQAVMDRIAGFNVHRGLLALASANHKPNPENLIAGAGPDAVAVMLANISNHDNVGSIFRNAAAFGATFVGLDQTCCDPLYRKALRVSVGGVLSVPWARCWPIEDWLAALVAAGFQIAALSPTGVKPIGDLPQSGKRVLLLGSEGHGLPERLLARLDAYRIPMAVSFDSLNVGTASGIALYSALRH